MKISIIQKTLLLGSFVAIVATGCKKDDFAINTEPDSITASTVDFKTVLPASLASTATIESTNFTFLQKWMGFWARSGSYQDITDEETYTFTNDFQNQIWFNNYYNATNYTFLIQKSQAAGAGFYEAIGRIMKAKNFQMLVDVYGNVPYSEAFRTTEIRTPKYDDDLEIYNDLFRQLDTAITLLNDPVLSSAVNNPSLSVNDLVYQGNALLWKKFANTLKLRMLMHTGNTNFAGGGEVNTFVAGVDQAGEMAKIVAEGSGFLGAGQSATINPGYNDTKPNPYYRAYVKTETGTEPGLGDQTKANAYAIGYYTGDGDPRINSFYNLPTSGATTHRGIPYGELAVAGSPNIGTNLSGIRAPGLVPTAASRAWILTSVESLFLQAEAARRGLLSGSAATLYNAALAESFAFLNLTPAQLTTYKNFNATYPDVDFAAGQVVAGGNSGGMYTILSQKWFSLNAIATLEVWSDYRRTGIVYGYSAGYDPGPPISVNPANTKTTIPIRLFYPQAEYNLNSQSVLAEGATINVFTGGGASGRNRIFWDKN